MKRRERERKLGIFYYNALQRINHGAWLCSALLHRGHCSLKSGALRSSKTRGAFRLSDPTQCLRQIGSFCDASEENMHTYRWRTSASRRKASLGSVMDGKSEDDRPRTRIRTNVSPERSAPPQLWPVTAQHAGGRSSRINSGNCHPLLHPLLPACLLLSCLFLCSPSLFPFSPFHIQASPPHGRGWTKISLHILWQTLSTLLPTRSKSWLTERLSLSTSCVLPTNR